MAAETEASPNDEPEAPEPVPKVRVDRDELRRALINLVTNARQADARTIRLRAGRDDGHVLLTVSDDGCGIRSKELKRIFEPSFTTKSSGTGLGLPIVKRLVDDLGGSIQIESSPGKGTTVRMRLPEAG